MKVSDLSPAEPRSVCGRIGMLRLTSVMIDSRGIPGLMLGYVVIQHISIFTLDPSLARKTIGGVCGNFEHTFHKILYIGMQSYQYILEVEQ